MGDSSESEAEDVNVFGTKEYDITDCALRWCSCCIGGRILTLSPEEADLKTTTCCSSSLKKIPYGELGGVTKASCCGIFHSFQSNLNGKDEQGQQTMFSPGCGCEKDLVEEVCQELRARMKARGDTGNIQRAEEALTLMRQMSARIDAILMHRNMQVPAVEEKAQALNAFEHKSFNMTDYCHMCVTCGGTKTLELEPEEAHLVVTTCCGSGTTRRPYGELGSVEAAKTCGICVGVNSGLGPMSPGCGCDSETVDEVVDELKQRMKHRGDTGNMQRQEGINRLLREEELKIDQICQKMGIQVPQAVPPPMQSMA